MSLASMPASFSAAITFCMAAVLAVSASRAVAASAVTPEVMRAWSGSTLTRAGGRHGDRAARLVVVGVRRPAAQPMQSKTDDGGTESGR